MQTLHVQTRSDSDRIVHLNIPVEAPDAAYDVVVVLQPRPDVSTPRTGLEIAVSEHFHSQPGPGVSTPPTAEERGWPAGFFETTAGAWKGDFVRDQGQFEEREAF